MTGSDLTDKLAQFNEFFSIEDDFTVNIIQLDPQAIGNYQAFVDCIPAPFKMASEIATIDQSALKPIQALSGIAGQLVDYLNFQARKIDMMMSYIVQQENLKENRHQGRSFGGGGFTFESNAVFSIGDMVEAKIFIPEDNCAIFCYGEIISTEQVNESTAETPLYIYQVVFYFIQDEDRDLLVRASLHKQSKQLKKLAEQRRQNKKDN